MKYKKATALSVFIKEYYKANSSTKIGDASSKWKELDDAKKQKYSQIAEEANKVNSKKLLPKAIDLFKNGLKNEKSIAKAFLTKNFNFPKAPENAYLLFLKDLVAKDTNAKYFSPENRVHWEKLSDSEREAYNQRFKQNVADYKTNVDCALKSLEQQALSLD